MINLVLADLYTKDSKLMKRDIKAKNDRIRKNTKTDCEKGK